MNTDNDPIAIGVPSSVRFIRNDAGRDRCHLTINNGRSQYETDLESGVTALHAFKQKQRVEVFLSSRVCTVKLLPDPIYRGRVILVCDPLPRAQGSSWITLQCETPLIPKSILPDDYRPNIYSLDSASILAAARAMADQNEVEILRVNDRNVVRICQPTKRTDRTADTHYAHAERSEE